MPCHVMPCNVMSCHVLSCHVSTFRYAARLPPLRPRKNSFGGANDHPHVRSSKRTGKQRTAADLRKAFSARRADAAAWFRAFQEDLTGSNLLPAHGGKQAPLPGGPDGGPDGAVDGANGADSATTADTAAGSVVVAGEGEGLSSSEVARKVFAIVRGAGRDKRSPGAGGMRYGGRGAGGGGRAGGVGGGGVGLGRGGNTRLEKEGTNTTAPRTNMGGSRFHARHLILACSTSQPAPASFQLFRGGGWGGSRNTSKGMFGCGFRDTAGRLVDYP